VKTLYRQNRQFFRGLIVLASPAEWVDRPRRHPSANLITSNIPQLPNSVILKKLIAQMLDENCDLECEFDPHPPRAGGGVAANQ
jgi:hypothetical protein